MLSTQHLIIILCDHIMNDWIGREKIKFDMRVDENRCIVSVLPLSFHRLRYSEFHDGVDTGKKCGVALKAKSARLVATARVAMKDIRLVLRRS